MFTSEEIIDLAIQIEKNAIRVYRGALKAADESDLSILIHWLIEDEIRHIQWFAALRRSVEKVSGDPKILEIGRALLRDTIGDASFSLEASQFDASVETNDVLELAAAFEMDKSRFFALLRPYAADAATLNDLDAIIAEEYRHVAYLRHFIDTNRVADVFAKRPVLPSRF